MKIRKESCVQGVILTAKNIKELAQVFYDEHKNVLELSKENDRYYSSLRFILKSEDGTQYEADDMSMFTEDGVLNNRKIVSVDMTHSSNKDDKYLSLVIQHSLEPFVFNGIVVAGLDEKWVNGILANLKEILSSCRSQRSFFTKHPVFIRIAIAAILYQFFGEVSVLLLSRVFKVITITTYSLRDKFYLWLMVIAALSIFVVPISGRIYDRIKALYPNIELLVGPEHLQRERQNRKKYYVLLSLVIIPLVIGIVLVLLF